MVGCSLADNIDPKKGMRDQYGAHLNSKSIGRKRARNLTLDHSSPAIFSAKLEITNARTE